MWRALLVAAMLAPAAAASEGWTCLRGSGLLTIPDTRTAPPRRLTLAFSVENRDRDPLGLDLLDGSLAWTLGLVPSLESYGHFVISRVVALPEPPALPPPPLDLVVAAGAAVPARPFYALYSPIPYVNKRGSARFDDWVPGDAVFGVKRRLREPNGRRPGLALGAELKLPLTKKLFSLQSGSGTGGVDLTGRLTAEWRSARHDFVASLAYTRVGSPAVDDRLVVIGSAGSAPLVSDLPLRLADRVDLGLGVRRALSRRLSAVVEAAAVMDVGGRTPVLDSRTPIDVSGGLQGRWGHGRLTLALLYHGHGLPSGQVRTAPLAGFVDLTDASDADTERFLGALGAAGAAGSLRAGAQKVVAAVPGALPPLPPGARTIPASYRVRSEHQVGFVMYWGWAF